MDIGFEGLSLHSFVISDAAHASVCHSSAVLFFFFSSRRRHTRLQGDWSSDVCSSDLTLISDYRFRGISQTYQKPAFQGGFDYAHASGLYAGNWNSNVSQGAGFPGGNIEMDFYGGYKRAFGDLGLDVGFIYYYYPGTKAGATTPFSPVNNKTGEVHSGKVDNKEIYIGGGAKWPSLKIFAPIADQLSTPGNKKTYYVHSSGRCQPGNNSSG